MTPLRTLLTSCLLLFVLSVLAPPAPAWAQGRSVEYTELDRIEAPGLLGAILARTGSGETIRAVHVLDKKMRTDEGSSSVIFDGDNWEWTILEHESRTYMTFTMEDFRAMSAELLQAMRDAEAEMDAEMEEARREMEEAQATLQASVQHIDTGERQEIRGYPAQRHHIIVTVEEAEGIQGAEEVEGGSMVVVMDLWLSPELARENPLYGEDSPFYRAMREDPELEEFAEEMEAFFGTGEPGAEAGVFALVDPRVGAATAEAFQTMAEMEGEPIISSMTVAVVPPAVEMDVEVILAWEPESMGSQIAGAASEAAQEAAREAARDAARGAVRGLTRGILGRDRGGDPDEAEVPEEDLIIRPLFRFTNEILEVRPGGVPSPDLFRVPEGYTPMPMPAMGAEPGER